MTDEEFARQAYEMAEVKDSHKSLMPGRRRRRARWSTDTFIPRSDAWREAAGTGPGQSREERAALAWELYRRWAQGE